MKKNEITLTIVCLILIISSCKPQPDLGGRVCINRRCIDVKTLADSLSKALEGNVVKYAFVIRHRGIMESRQGGTLQENSNLNEPFTISTEYNPASVTKTITAVAMLRKLERNGLGINDRIWPYLPKDWNLSPEIKQLTFKQILTHHSGMRARHDPYPPNYAAVRRAIELGIQPTDTTIYFYNNINYAICRILLVFLDKYKPLNYNDQGVGTSQHFVSCIQREIFDTLGIRNISFAPNPASKLLFYPYPVNGAQGALHHDWSLSPGSAGIQLTTFQLSNFLFYLDYSNILVSRSMHKLMFDELIGWDGRNNITGHEYFIKRGDFPYPELHTALIDFTSGLQITIVINGPIFCESVVRDAFLKSLKPE